MSKSDCDLVCHHESSDRFTSFFFLLLFYLHLLTSCVLLLCFHFLSFFSYYTRLLASFLPSFLRFLLSLTVFLFLGFLFQFPSFPSLAFFLPASLTFLLPSFLPYFLPCFDCLSFFLGLSSFFSFLLFFLWLSSFLPSLTSFLPSLLS